MDNDLLHTLYRVAGFLRRTDLLLSQGAQIVTFLGSKQYKTFPPFGLAPVSTI